MNSGVNICLLPMSYMGFNYSSGSSSSSFRDYRFVAVFSSDGKPIPQFNPNTAGAVVNSDYFDTLISAFGLYVSLLGIKATTENTLQLARQYLFCLTLAG